MAGRPPTTICVNIGSVSASDSSSSASSTSSASSSARSALAALAISLIDLTDLSDDHSPDGIDELCARAAEFGTAAVCVWPEFVERCAELLAGTGVGIATVVNFPGGNQPLGQVLDQTLTALSDGATEIDLVMPYKMFRNGDVKPAATVIESVGDIIAPPALFKVILETGELDDATIRGAAELAIGLGADFVKTSTGKTERSATLDAAGIILETIAAADRRVGIKPSGGIRTLDDAAAYLALAEKVMGSGWPSPSTFRFGASGLLDDLLSEMAETNGES